MEFSARYTLAGFFVLATIVAVFGFVYWLTNSGGLGETTPYRIRFTVPVSGLSNGSDVLFNGIKVGEVESLSFDPSDPEVTIAQTNISVLAPVRADTVVGIAFQGLTGAASILMTGGSSDAAFPSTSPDGLPELTADPVASRSWTDNAGRVLGRFDKMLSDNSGRFDAILAGLERLAGGGSAGAEKRLYDLPVPELSQPASRPGGWQLAIAEPTVLLSLNTDKIQLKGADGSLTQMDGPQWTDNLPNLFQTKLLRAFEDAGHAGSVVRPADVFEPEYRLAVDIRTFDLAATAPPAAEAELTARLLAQDGTAAATKPFLVRVEAASSSQADGIAALQAAFEEMATQLVAWTLEQLPAGDEAAEPE